MCSAGCLKVRFQVAGLFWIHNPLAAFIISSVEFWDNISREFYASQLMKQVLTEAMRLQSHARLGLQGPSARRFLSAGRYAFTSRSRTTGGSLCTTARCQATAEVTTPPAAPAAAATVAATNGTPLSVPRERREFNPRTSIKELLVRRGLQVACKVQHLGQQAWLCVRIMQMPLCNGQHVYSMVVLAQKWRDYAARASLMAQHTLKRIAGVI